MPFLTEALDPVQVQRRLMECCPAWGKRLGQVEVRAIRVVRHKVGRRCLIEYELSAPQLTPGLVIILGKVRAKGLDRKTFELQQTLWRGDFGPQSADGISVPEPIGMIPALHMWLQAKAPGIAMTEVLSKADGVMLARLAAEAVCKLHRTEVSTYRSHNMSDELRILREL